MDGWCPLLCKEKRGYLPSSTSGCEVARCSSVLIFVTVSYMKIKGYVKGFDKVALALHCISSFSLDPNLALVRNTCLISQFFSCQEPAMLTETNELFGRGGQKSAWVPDVRDVQKHKTQLPFLPISYCISQFCCCQCHVFICNYCLAEGSIYFQWWQKFSVTVLF